MGASKSPEERAERTPVAPFCQFWFLFRSQQAIDWRRSRRIGMSIGYVTIGAHDVEAALPFFDAALGAIATP
jgi:hypothetical protein